MTNPNISELSREFAGKIMCFFRFHDLKKDRVPINGGKFFVRIRNSGKMSIQCQDFVVEAYPTLALLKALAYQWDVEVEG